MARLLVTLLVLAIPVLGGIVHHASLDGLQDPQELDQLVVTTANPEPLRAADIVPLDSSKERSRFLVTLLMLQSLHDTPSNASTVDPKLEKQLLADEEVMQEVLKLYETTQETKGKHYIKIPPKLMKKMRRTMKELLSD